eukprot:3641040-Pleurochrysis_carterae.AAC.1
METTNSRRRRCHRPNHPPRAQAGAQSVTGGRRRTTATALPPGPGWTRSPARAGGRPGQELDKSRHDEQQRQHPWCRPQPRTPSGGAGAAPPGGDDER